MDQPERSPTRTQPAPATTGAAADRRAQIGVIGGSGFYAFLEDATEVKVSTPYGEPSDPLVVGEDRKSVV